MRGRRTVWRGKERRFYVCSDQVRYHSCASRPVRADDLEAEFVQWLGTCRPPAALEQAARELVVRGMRQKRIPAKETDDRGRARALAEQLRRTHQVYRAGGLTEREWQAETQRINTALAALEDRSAQPETLRERSQRLTDLVAAWRDAKLEQRARLAAAVVSEIQVTDGRLSAIRPRGAWVSYFEELCTMERETSLELATSTLATLRSTN